MKLRCVSVLLVSVTVVSRAGFVNSGEASLWRRRVGSPIRPPLAPLVGSSPLDPISKALIRGYRFAGGYAKETLGNSCFEPAVKGALAVLRFPSFESVFSVADFKCAFQKLQNCY